jgi:NTP pyrophosphatase (non-canonical NTP hydrolase)
MRLTQEYNEFVSKTKFYPKHRKIEYPVLGICGEAGEVAEKVKKTIRDNNEVFDAERKAAILKELGDVLWYVVATAQDMGYDFEDVIHANMSKVTKRLETNTRQGEGDDREEV